MLSDISVKRLREILSQSLNYTVEQQNSIVSFLSNYSHGQRIYPSALKRELHISMEDSYKILETLSDEGFLEGWYEYRCGNSQNLVGLVRYINELPPTFECENCNSPMNTLENTIKIYKVI